MKGKKRARPSKSARAASSTSRPYTKTNTTNTTKSKNPKSGQKGGKGRGKGKGQSKGKGGSLETPGRRPLPSPSAAVTHRKVVNLAPKTVHIPPPLVSGLGLGPVFRPVPPPLSDSKVVAAIRRFSTDVKTRAYFVLQPPAETEQNSYNPKLYTPTGNKCNPMDPALDHCLDQFQICITEALSQNTDHLPRAHSNITRQEWRALRAFQSALESGESDLASTFADKDKAIVLMTPEQYSQCWRVHTEGPVFSPADPDTIPWPRFSSKVRVLAGKALEDGVIDRSIHRFLTQHCTGESRKPRAQILVKTHKPMCPTDNPPADTRLYIDTVQYTTTPLAKFISVMLTPARERIPHRIRDTAHLMSQLSEATFPQSVKLITMDVKDFYPNTTTTEGERVIRDHADSTVVDLCVEFNQLIHESMYVQTPDGWYSVPDRYGIGFGHSCEICDLGYSPTEQRVLQHLASRHGLIPMFYGRDIDDILMIIDCTDHEASIISREFEAADPSKPIKATVSSQSVDYLDVTLFKGPGFRQTGKLDTKLYTKPSSSHLHLPRTSHHPESTFQSILSGQKMRSIIASSCLQHHRTEMVERYKQYLARGYSREELKSMLWQSPTVQQQQAKTNKWEEESKFRQLRRSLLKQKPRDEVEKVIPLRLNYTPRTDQLSHHLNLAKLQDNIEAHNPALSRASIGRFTIANLKTQSLRGSVRQRYR